MNSILQAVSITGADDHTDIEELRAMTQRYPFVEWALLYVPSAGGPRNPTQTWREHFFDAALPCTSAVHLCFKEAFAQLIEGTLPREVLRANRLQLNINARREDFSAGEVFEVYRRSLDLGPDVILQRHSGTSDIVERFLSGLAPSDACRVHVLLDDSRGKGVAPANWDVPLALDSAYCGFAGGIGPGNIATVLPELQGMQRSYWIDMESHVRTDNELDLHKVRQVLEASQAYL